MREIILGARSSSLAQMASLLCAPAAPRPAEPIEVIGINEEKMHDSTSNPIEVLRQALYVHVPPAFPVSSDGPIEEFKRLSSLAIRSSGVMPEETWMRWREICDSWNGNRKPSGKRAQRRMSKPWAGRK